MGKLKDEDHKWKVQVSDVIDRWPDKIDEKYKKELKDLAIKVKYEFPAKCTKYDKNGKVTSTKMVYYDLKAMRDLSSINDKLQPYFKSLNLDTYNF